MLNIKQLQVFLTVVKEQNFTKAASQLFMTQPAISWQIKSLEKDLGVLLLERGERNIIPTDAGQVLITYAQKMMDIYEQTIAAIEEVKGFQRGRLQIAASTIPGEYILPQMVGRFKKEYPGIEIALGIADTGKVVESILADEVHLGIIGAKIPDSRLSFRPFFQDRLVLIVPPAHTLLQNKEVTLKELVGVPIVMRENGSGTRMVLEKQWLASGLRLTQMSVEMELGSTRAIISAVEAGLGISIVSYLAAEEALTLGKIYQIPLKENSFQRDLYIVTREGREIGNLAARFIEFLAIVFSRQL